MNLRVFLFFVLCGMHVHCSYLPKIRHKTYSFPKNAFTGTVERPHRSLGWVRSKVNFISLDPNQEEGILCKNYYNQSVQQLVSLAKKKGGDAVIQVQSVVFLADGRQETYPTAECADEGLESQILTQGIAIQWISPHARH